MKRQKKSRLQKQLDNFKRMDLEFFNIIDSSYYESFPKYLSSDNPRSPLVLATNVGLLASSFGKKAYSFSVDSNIHMGYLAQSINLYSWAAAMRCQFHYDRALVDFDDLNDIVCLTANLICCSPHWAREGEILLRRMVEDAEKPKASHPRAVIPEFWASRCFEPFVLACLDIEHGVSPDLSNITEPYREVLKVFGDAEKCAAALKNVCDYHVSAIDDNDGWGSEFKAAPFDLLPCEVKLVCRIRETLGFEPLTVDHELVHFFKNSMCEIPPAADLPIIDEVRKAFRRHGLEV